MAQEPASEHEKTDTVRSRVSNGWYLISGSTAPCEKNLKSRGLGNGKAGEQYE